MKIIFLGSGSFACPVVKALLDAKRHELVAVVTQPDRPKGRSLHVAACPVKELVAGGGIPVLTPERVGDAVDAIAAHRPDLLVVADYGQYIPSRVVLIASHQAINIHPSLLPKYRGAAPVQWALANGEKMTGVTVQYVAKKMDSGEILLQQNFSISDDETAESLEARLAEAGAPLMLKALDLIDSGHVHATPQDEREATYAPKLKKEDGLVDWSMPAEHIVRRIRAFQPWPGCWVQTSQGPLKLLRAATRRGTWNLELGTIIDITESGLLIKSGSDAVSLVEVQPASRKPMSGADYARGARLKPGDTLA
jgi:methionyl-tRNA formyltransferase